MTINFDGIQLNMAVLMYFTFQVNKYGFLILFYIISNHLYVVIVTFDLPQYASIVFPLAMIIVVCCSIIDID